MRLLLWVRGLVEILIGIYAAFNEFYGIEFDVCVGRATWE